MNNLKFILRENIPEKAFFKLAEIANLLDISKTDIRYWESQFSELRSHKTRSGKRLYKQEDAVLLSAIKHLVKERKFTMAAAKRIIAESDALNNEIEIASSSKKMNAHTDNIKEVLEYNNTSKEESSQESDLRDASLFFEPSDEIIFKEQTQEIQQECGSELNNIEQEISKPIMDSNSSSLDQEKKDRIERALEYERAVGVLLAQKEALTELLGAISKYAKRPFISVNKSPMEPN